MLETETGKHRSEVGRLLVSPDFRKRGLARELMRVLEEVARERGRWMVVRGLVLAVLITYELFTNDLTASRHNNRQRSRARVPKIGLQGSWCCTELRLQSKGRQPGRRDLLLQRCEANLRRFTAMYAGCCTFGIEGIDNVQLMKTMNRNIFTSPGTLLRGLLPLDLALVHAGVAHGSGRCLGRLSDGGDSGLCWRCEGFGDRAGRAVSDLVDIASGEDVAEVAATRLDDDVGRTLEVEEELMEVSEILHLQQLKTHPITPDGLASPSSQCERSVTGEPPHSRLPHRLPEARVW